MHESIAAFPSNQFYGGQLITATARPIPVWHSPSLPTYCFWNIVSTTKGKHFNAQEADFITNKLLSSLAAYDLSVGIISFYRDQGENSYAHIALGCLVCDH